MKVPLGDNSVDVRSVANKTCSNKAKIGRRQKCNQGQNVRRHLVGLLALIQRDQAADYTLGMAFGSNESPIHFKFKLSWQPQAHFSFFFNHFSLLFFPPFVLKDINHSNRLQGLAVLLGCGVVHPIILEKKRSFAHWNCVGR